MQPMGKAPAEAKRAPVGGGVLGAAAGWHRPTGISVTLVHGATREGGLWPCPRDCNWERGGAEWNWIIELDNGMSNWIIELDNGSVVE